MALRDHCAYQQRGPRRVKNREVGSRDCILQIALSNEKLCRAERLDRACPFAQDKVSIQSTDTPSRSTASWNG